MCRLNKIHNNYTLWNIPILSAVILCRKTFDSEVNVNIIKVKRCQLVSLY